MRVAVYARLSRRSEFNAPNLDDQLKRCREHADKRGWVIVAEHTDYGESAYDRDEAADRPAYADLLADVKANRIDVVLAWRPDRLWRDPIECALLMRDCVKHKVQLVATVTEGDRDPANPGDEMVATIVAAVGRYESASKSARIRAKHRQIAETGRTTGGGHPAYGYATKDRQTIDEAEAAVIREAVAGVLAGRAIYSVAVGLNRRGERTKLGKQWTSANLGRLLRSPHYAALRQHRGEVIGAGTWPAIVDEAAWLAVQDVLSNADHRFYGPGADYLLTRGLAVCGCERCGVALVARPSAVGKRSYVCPGGAEGRGCGKIRRLAEPLEADVEQRFLARLNVIALNHVDVPEVDAVTAEDVHAAELALTGLARDHYVLKVIDRAEYLTARGPLAAEAERLRRLLAAASAGSPAGPDELIDGWEYMTIAEKREAMRPYVDRVVVLPAVKGRNTYDSDRVEVWFTD